MFIQLNDDGETEFLAGKVPIQDRYQVLLKIKGPPDWYLVRIDQKGQFRAIVSKTSMEEIIYADPSFIYTLGEVDSPSAWIECRKAREASFENNKEAAILLLKK